MVETYKRPSFIDAWLTDIHDDYRRYGCWKLIPYTIVLCAGIGAIVAWQMPQDKFWDKPDVSVPFYAAFVTINGLILALSWTAFSKIYEIASAPMFANFLRRHGLLNSYFFHVDFIHVCQIAALASSGAAMILTVLPQTPATLNRIALGLTIATAIYALRYALGAVRIMQDLVWYRAAFDTGEGGPGAREGIRVHEGGRAASRSPD